MANAAAAAAILKSIIGEKQLGGVAPAFNTEGGGSQVSSADLLSNLLNIQQASQPLPQQAPQGGVTEAVSDLPITSEPSVFNTQAQNQSMQDQSMQGPGIVEGFFGNVDQNLQSPSKLLGLGLLSQIDPRLAQGGLLASGLFGKNKLF